MKQDLLLRIIKYTLRPVIGIAVCLIFIFFFSGKISALSDSMRGKQTNSAILNKKIETVRTLQANFATLGDKNYNAVLNAFPTDQDVHDIGVAIDKLASSTNVTLNKTFGSVTATGIEIKEPGSTLSTIDISMTMTATESQFLRFLKGLEKLQYFVDIQKISIGGGSQQGWDGQSSIGLSGKVFLKQVPQ